MKTISELTGREYEIDDVIWYGNVTQFGQYFLWGCRPVDVTVDPRTKRVAFAINIADHQKYIGRWNAQRDKQNHDESRQKI